MELVRTAIDRIVPDGVVDVEGTHYPADVICFATGFRHNDFLASMDVRGRHGRTLRDEWGDEPTAYLGVTVSGFPNLFCVYGPGTNLAAGASLFYHSEFQVHYALEAIHETLATGHRCCEVRRSAHDEYAAALRSRDRADGLVAPLHPSQPLQEPGGQGVHLVALGPGPVLGVDPAPRERRLRVQLGITEVSRWWASWPR